MSQFDKITRVLSSPPPPPAASESGDDWLDVQALFRVVRRRVKLILFVGTLVLLALVPLILTMERTYSAATRVLINEPLPPTLAASALVSDSELNLTTEAERLMSRKLAVRVISELGLQEQPEFNPALRDQQPLARVRNHLRALLPGAEIGAVQEADQMDPIVRSFIARLGIFQAPGSEVVSISFTSEDPTSAALVPNTLVRVYLEESQERLADRTARATAWVEGRVTEQARRLADAVAALNAVSGEAEDAAAGAPGAQEALADLNERRGSIVRSRAELATRLDALEGAEDVQGRAEAIDTESVFMLSRQLDAEKAELERLLRRYGPAQAGVVAAEARIAAEVRIAGLERAIEQEIERERRNLLTQLAALDREESAILARLTAAEESLANNRKTEAQLAELKRVVDVERSALDGLEQQLRALRAEANLPAAEIEVLSPATVPLVADGRSRMTYLIAAVFAAGALALTAALVVEMLDKGVRSHEQLRNIPGIAAAGFIPAVPRRALHNPRTRRLQAARQLYRESVEAVILALEQQNSGALPTSILVTSPLPGEGVSTTAFALACELAASGRGVVLVDADHRNGKLNERFGVAAEPGFSDYLAGSARLDQILRTDASSGISFITRGSAGVRRPIDRMLTKTLISSASANQQVVIFDAAPALVTNEALMLASVAGRTLLIVQWARTSRPAVESAVERLSQRGGADLAVLINRVNLRRQALYGYRDAGDLARSMRRYHLAR